MGQKEGDVWPFVNEHEGEEKGRERERYCDHEVALATSEISFSRLTKADGRILITHLTPTVGKDRPIGRDRKGWRLHLVKSTKKKNGVEMARRA